MHKAAVLTPADKKVLQAWSHSFSEEADEVADSEKDQKSDEL